MEESKERKIRLKKRKRKTGEGICGDKVIRKREDIHRKLKKDKLVSMPFRLQSFR